MELKINLEKREELRLVFKNNRKKNIANKILNKFLYFVFKNNLIKKILSKGSESLILKKYTLNSNKIKKSIKILFLSDLHLDVVNNNERIKKILKNKSYDYIFMGGDIFDHDNISDLNIKECKDLIAFLRSKTKSGIILSVLGNHDAKKTAKLLDAETTLLIDNHFEDECCFIYGTEDYVTFKDAEDFKGNFPVDKFSILLSHTPNFYSKIENKYDLMLSGHTHGGQVSFFGFAPLNYCKRKEMIYGKWEYENTVGITSSGVGCSGYPIRIGIKPEIIEVVIKNTD